MLEPLHTRNLCRRPILSGLLVFFYFFIFFGPRSVFLLYQVFESCCLVMYFVIIRRYLSLNVMSCLLNFYLNFVLYSIYVSYFILNLVKCYMSYVKYFVLFRKFVKVMFVFI